MINNCTQPEELFANEADIHLCDIRLGECKEHSILIYRRFLSPALKMFTVGKLKHPTLLIFFYENVQ